MIPYSDLQSAVIRNLQISATDEDINRFKIKESINDALLSILNTLPDQFIQNAIATVNMPLVKGVSKYQTPDNFIRAVQVWINFNSPITDNNLGRKAIIYKSDVEVTDPSALADKYFPVIDFGIEKGMAIYPIPDKTISNGIRLRYVYKQPEINENQPCLLDLRLKNILIFTATALAASIEGYNLALAEKYEQMAEAEKISIMGGKAK